MTTASDVLLERAREIAREPAAAPVPSPCISVCRMNAFTGLCEGCLRDIDEIAGWARMGEAQKREVWQRIEERAGA